MRFAGEDEERHLECILGVMMIPQDPATDAPDERAIAANEFLECGVFSAGDESIEPLGVRQAAEGPEVEECLQVTGGHLHP
ncbi:hypothetical protein [Singulisphaera sp. PoT]|uniref:hypothetical protein n=1 Tax=Singulisphaera sp. PoT TaxID=3411797 RepID=UPI003BF5E57E